MPSRACRPFVARLLLLAVAVTLTPGTRPAQAEPFATGQPPTAPPRPAVRSVRFLVTLADPPLLALVRDRRSAPLPRDARGKVRLDSSPARAHLQRLDAARGALRAALHRALPGVRVEREYRLIANGLVVAAPLSDAPALRRLPGVRRVERIDLRRYRPVLDTSVPLIRAGDLWTAEPGGAAKAGAGVKVAVVDTGIAIDNPFFDPAGFTYPPEFPKGATAFTTAKVIAARVYLRPDDPVDTSRDEPTPIDHLGHGSHVAGIIAGNRATTFDVHGTPVSVSGVAPRAQLMNYRVFYRALSGDEEAADPELMAAFEDAIADGADVINNSWGGPEVLTAAVGGDTPYALAVEAGVVVVFAAGNDGPGESTIGWPGSHERFITVGSTATGRSFARTLDVTGPTPVDPSLASLRLARAYGSPDFTSDLAGTLRSAASVDDGGNLLGCQPFGADAFAGVIAVVLRGTCTFTEKIGHAADAGATAVVVVNNEAGPPFAMATDKVAVPAVMISRDDGAALAPFLAAHADATGALRAAPRTFVTPAEVDRVSGFSSVGPTSAATLKPDVAAPGELILSANAGPVGKDTPPYALLQGTSMATPHVSGAAALLKQLHPAWGHDEIKAALVATAARGCTRSDGTGPATPLEVGGGRVQLDRLARVEVVFDPPVVGLGEAQAGELVERQVTLRRLDPEVSAVTLSWAPATAPGTPLILPAAGTPVTFAGDSATVNVVFGVNPTDGAGDYSGWLVARTPAGTEYQAPYYLRVRPERDREVLLVDMSFADARGDLSPLDRYAEILTAAGIDFDRVEPAGAIPVPPLESLLAYRAVVVATGNDSQFYFWPQGVVSLDRLAAYLHQGGRVVVAGQGPFRGTGVEALTALLGSETPAGYPLVDPSNGYLLDLADYTAVPQEPFPLTSDAVRLDPAGPGDLKLVGSANLVALSELALSFVRPAFTTRPGPWETPFVSGVVFDPFPSYGEDPEAELSRHRAVVLQFGLEAMIDPTPGEASPGSPVELAQNALRWVTEEVDLEVTPRVDGYTLNLAAAAVSTNGAVTGYTFRFGDGSDEVAGAAPQAAHTYERFGTYPVVVVARSDLDGAAVWRRDVYVGPPVLIDGGIGDATATDGGAELPPIATCGGCRAGRRAPAAPLLLVLLALAVVRRAARRRDP